MPRSHFTFFTKLWETRSVYTTYTLLIHYAYSVYILRIHCLYTTHTLCIHYVHTAYILRILCVYITYTLRILLIHYVYIKYPLRVHYGRMDPLPGYSRWDLWWVNCHCSRFISKYVSFPLSVSIRHCFLFIVIHQPTTICSPGTECHWISHKSFKITRMWSSLPYAQTHSTSIKLNTCRCCVLGSGGQNCRRFLLAGCW
jgi:hypothetical protein